MINCCTITFKNFMSKINKEPLKSIIEKGPTIFKFECSGCHTIYKVLCGKVADISVNPEESQRIDETIQNNLFLFEEETCTQ